MHKSKVAERWSEVVADRRKLLHSSFPTHFDLAVRAELHTQAIKEMGRVRATGQLLLAPRQLVCAHRELLFLYQRQSAPPARPCSHLPCAVCTRLCASSLTVCLACSHNSPHTSAICSACSSSAVFPSSVFPSSAYPSTPSHALHPLSNIAVPSVCADYICGCLLCGMSAVLRVTNESPSPALAYTSFLQVSFLCPSSQGIFRGVEEGRRRATVLERMKRMDLLTSASAS